MNRRWIAGALMIWALGLITGLVAGWQVGSSGPGSTAAWPAPGPLWCLAGGLLLLLPVAAGPRRVFEAWRSAAACLRRRRGHRAAPRACPGPPPRAPQPPAAAPPTGGARVRFVTPEGFHYWPVESAPGCAAAGEVGRTYEIRSPAGEAHRCTVMLPDGLQSRVQAEAGGKLAPSDPAWDCICRSALSRQLGRAWPSAAFLVASGLTREQLAVVRIRSGQRHRAWE